MTISIHISHPQCSKLWTAAGAMSGPYGSGNSVRGHANPLQSTLNEAFIIRQIVDAVVVSKNSLPPVKMFRVAAG